MKIHFLLTALLLLSVTTLSRNDIEQNIYNIFNGFLIEIQSNPNDINGCYQKIKGIEDSLTIIIEALMNFDQNQLMDLIANVTKIGGDVMKIPDKCKLSFIWDTIQKYWKNPKKFVDDLVNNADKVGDALSDMKVGIMSEDFIKIGKSVGELFVAFLSIHI